MAWDVSKVAYCLHSNQEAFISIMATLANVEHRNQEATIYCGNLDPSVTEDLLVELFTQIGRVNSVHMPKDKLTGLHSGK